MGADCVQEGMQAEVAEVARLTVDLSYLGLHALLDAASTHQTKEYAP